MRGNHRQLGRNDIPEPERMTGEELRILDRVMIAPTPGKKTWLSVIDAGGNVIGYVTQRMHGQYFRTPSINYWILAADKYCDSDPRCARAALELERYLANAQLTCKPESLAQ